MRGLLFIDDEAGVRRSVTRALRREPYETHTAASGKDGIDFFKKNISRISTVISDYRMPGLSGLETLSMIGSLNPEITRIILTGYATMEAAIHATNQGIDGFLTKPFDNLELRAKIRDIFIRKHLKQFVPEQVYQEIRNSPGALKPTYHEASILFSDIRGFTQMSQEFSPDAIAAFLNDNYFAPFGEIAYNFNGTVDKHIGDSIMVAYGSPIPHVDDALNAVRSAMAMQKKAKEIDTMLKTRNGLSLKVGIGISTGRVFSGILGSLRIKEFTSIGMPVNIAARLQGMAKKGEILINERTFQKLSNEVDAELLPPAKVKGIDAPINVYRVMG
ncbi:MAG: adenylate/guanylate cyclase domain-containing protein [Pseudomonadota bacterium]